jgi:amidase
MSPHTPGKQSQPRAARRRRWSLVLGALATVSALAVPAPAGATKIGRSFTLEEATIASVRGALLAKRITCRQLVQGYLRRIGAHEDDLNALIAVNGRALAAASQLDERARRSGLVGPLHCVPMLVKDNYDTAELPTTASSRSLAGSRPPNDATAIRKLKKAGAIVLAKANLTEFALTGITFGSLGGQTRNPYELRRTPGGSSGGTGAGLAANFGLLGTGTDTVNSIRSPSSANSLVGIRPTMGLVSRDGIVPVSSTQDTAGPIARTVTDAATALSVMDGYDPADAVTARSNGNLESSYRDELDTEALHGARIGIFTSFLGTDPALHGEVNAIVTRAGRDMRAQGAKVLPVSLAGVSANGLIADLDVQRFEIRSQLNAYLGSFDAPRRNLDEILASGEVDPLFVNTLRIANSFQNGLEEPEYRTRLQRIQTFRDRVLKLLADHDLDALVYPQQKRLVVPIGEDQVDRNGIMAAVTGFPSVTVPAGFSAATAAAPRGVPVGIELFGRPWTEQKLIRYAYAFERATRHRKPPAGTPSVAPGR